MHILGIDKLGLKTRDDAQETSIKMSHIIKNFVYYPTNNDPQTANIL